MNAGKSIGINSLSFDLQALEVIARANYLLTLHDRKQRNLQQVIALTLESPPELEEALIKRVEALRPFAGGTILAVRLDSQQQVRAEIIKTKVLDGFGYHWQLRDVVIYLCQGLIEKLS